MAKKPKPFRVALRVRVPPEMLQHLISRVETLEEGMIEERVFVNMENAIAALKAKTAELTAENARLMNLIAIEKHNTDNFKRLLGDDFDYLCSAVEALNRDEAGNIIPLKPLSRMVRGYV